MRTYGQHLRPVHSLIPSSTVHSRSAKIRAWSSSNGAHLSNGQHHMDSSQATREMHIASTDFDDYGEHGNDGMNRRSSVHVVPPRKGAPQQLQRYGDGGLSLSEGAMRSEMKAVKAELSITKAENQQKAVDLAESESRLRAKEAEVTLLRAAMTGRDISLRNANIEAAEAQAALRTKDEELQGVFQQLMSNAKERGDLRQQLLSIQSELSAARTELETWAQQGFQLMEAAEKLSDAAKNGTPVEEDEFAAPPRTNGRAARGGRPPLDPDQMTKLLESLQKLSQSIADDAQADEQVLCQLQR